MQISHVSFIQVFTRPTSSYAQKYGTGTFFGHLYPFRVQLSYSFLVLDYVCL